MIPTTMKITPTIMNRRPNCSIIPSVARLHFTKKVRGFEGRGLGAIGPVRRVALDREAEVAPDRPRRGLGGIGRPHQVAPEPDRVLPFEDHQDDRPLGHESRQAREERPLAVHGVKPLGLLARELGHLERLHTQARRLDAPDDLADQGARHSIRLDDRESLLGHGLPRTRATVSPISAGLTTTSSPARRIASIFSAAVPFPPEMIAPACPIRRPAGAVWPAMKPTTGLVMFSRTYRAASSSAVPPISPLMTTTWVSGSSLKSRSAS